MGGLPAPKESDAVATPPFYFNRMGVRKKKEGKFEMNSNNKFTLIAVMIILFFCFGISNGFSDEQKIDDDKTKKSVEKSRTEDKETSIQGKQKITPGPGEVFMNIGEVVVEAKSETKANIDLPGSVDIIGEDQLRKEVTSNALELLRRIPGFIYRDYGNGGVPNGFTMRGFNSNHGSDNLVTIDGIPINDHFWQEDGAPDFNQLTSEEIESIVVIKGPIDARYGNWGRAGIVNIETRKRGDFLKSYLSLGSWGTRKAYVSFGSEHFDHKFNQVYSAEYYDTDGWRENSEQKRQNAYAKWYYRPFSDIQIGLQTHVYKADWSTGGYITEEQWKDDPRQAFASAQDDGGKKELQEVSLHLDWNIKRDMPLEARLWYKTNKASRWADWGGGQTEMFTKESVLGILANLGYLKNLHSESKIRVDSGFDWRYFDSNYQDWDTDARVRTSVNSNDDYIFNNFGVYLKSNYDMNKYIRLFAGIRHDFFSGNTKNKLTGDKRDMDDYNVTTYKGGIIGNISDRYSVYANIGTTFTLPRKELKYAENHPDVNDLLFREIGVKANPFDWLLLRYAYFYSDEDVVAFVAGDYVSQGKAIRKGHELEINIFPLEGLTVFTALTLDNSKFDGGPNDGNWVTSVPKYIWNTGVQYDSKFGTGARLWYRDVGKWYTDTSNEHNYKGYNTADFTIYHTIADKWTVSLDIKNIFNQKYAEFVGFWSGSNQYMSSNPRGFYVSLRYNM